MADEQESPDWNPKLYVVTRSDLPPGAQACQAIHAVCEFASQHPEAYQKWYKESNYLAFLSVKNVAKLVGYLAKASHREIKHSSFHEPDFGGDLTAAVFDATMDAREMLKKEKSALKKNWYGGIKE